MLCRVLKKRGGLRLKLVVKYHLELYDTWPFGQTFMAKIGYNKLPIPQSDSLALVLPEGVVSVTF